jgi:hypothetical protein
MRGGGLTARARHWRDLALNAPWSGLGIEIAGEPRICPGEFLFAACATEKGEGKHLPGDALGALPVRKMRAVTVGAGCDERNSWPRDGKGADCRPLP